MKKKTQKIIICISLVIMLFVNFGNVFGATNPDYTPQISVSESVLDTKIKSSILLDTLANMINALASLAEYLIGAVFETLTGDNIFPWADRIIFNGIGFLDINFLNPADNSLFVYQGNDSILGQVVKKVYSTIFSLAVLFLGVAVGIMAIRLAISSIASEKAKYKQAIVNWATCIVMLFLMHYILAFVFWINEQMVRVASGILIQTIDEMKLDTVSFQEALDAVLEPEERVELYKESMDSMATSIAEGFLSHINAGSTDEVNAHKQIITDNADIANKFLSDTEGYVKKRMVYTQDNTQNWTEDIGAQIGYTKEMAYLIGLPRIGIDTAVAAKIKNENLADQIKEDGCFISGIGNNNIYLDKEKYITSQDYIADLRAYVYCISGSEAGILAMYYANPQIKVCNQKNPNYYTAAFGPLFGDFFALHDVNLSKEEIEEKLGSAEVNKLINLRLEIDRMIFNAAIGETSSKPTDIIANLGSFFKQSAYVYTSESVTTESGGEEEVITGWRASKVSVTGALLYAIFIFQSCMYLIMYVKRLFYVIMLSMFGPIVVIYDFFIKSAS